METKEHLLKGFEGLTEGASIDYQLDNWVKGVPLHNPIRDECCPDFSCCKPELLVDEDTRIKYKEYVDQGNDLQASELLGSFLSRAVSSIQGVEVVAGCEE